MKRSLLFIIITVVCCIITISCNKNNGGYSRDELEKIKNYSTFELIDYMYDGCRKKKDYNALSRILNASPSSLERLRKGETLPTSDFALKAKLVSNDYARCGCSIYELRRKYDDLKWYELLLHRNYPKWLKISLYILDFLFLIMLFVGKEKIIGCLYAIGVLVVITYIIALLLAAMPQNVKDYYVDKLDNKVEVEYIIK